LIADSTQPTTAATGTHRRTVTPRANSRAASLGRDQGGHRATEAAGRTGDVMAGVPSFSAVAGAVSSPPGRAIGRRRTLAS
jgi:hypothetical protein